MRGYACYGKVEQIKREIKVVTVDMAIEAGLGVALRVIPIPVVRGVIAVAKIVVDVKTLYDSVKLMKHGFEAMD